MKVLPSPLIANSAIPSISEADKGDLFKIFALKTKLHSPIASPIKMPIFWSF